uniref:Class I SAM-dependent methyltransferase n=1 Tax=Lotharella oceanica TaxID=641309 RepID=A0A7S2TZI9_9EUKA|mmetsp:Transcript_37199/g.68631  ORF Transcript_37199/g.68631 Transcript_37199/m.68631 type:complete len:303 (+) Transcript_37199:90-998(+)
MSTNGIGEKARRLVHMKVQMPLGRLVGLTLGTFVLGAWFSTSSHSPASQQAVEPPRRLPGVGLAVARVVPGGSECDLQLRKIFDKGLWKGVDLAAYDAMASAMDKVMPEIEEGHSGQMTVERQAYVAVAQLPCVRRICEIGFNGGHSAGLWLRAAPQADVLMFDLWNYTYNSRGEAFLRDSANGQKFGLADADRRLTIVKGSSLTTVPAYAREHPDVKCDVLSVDGGHFEDIARADLWSMFNLANRNFHVLLLDDTNCEGFWCNGPIAALQHAMSLGLVRYIAGITEENVGRGLSILQYVKS